MITLDDIRICEYCGNVFARKIENQILNRCPACNVWKKETIH